MSKYYPLRVWLINFAISLGLVLILPIVFGVWYLLKGSWDSVELSLIFAAFGVGVITGVYLVHRIICFLSNRITKNDTAALVLNFILLPLIIVSLTFYIVYSDLYLNDTGLVGLTIFLYLIPVACCYMVILPTVLYRRIKMPKNS